MSPPLIVEETFLLPKAMVQDIDACLATVQEERRRRAMPPLSRHDFVVYGLLKAGMQTFEATKEVTDRESRMVLLPSELGR